MGILDFLFGKSKAVEKLDKNTIYQKYYTDYPEKPYISNERNIREWLERAEMFPSQSLVSRNMMVRYNDGLLPGHIYMLYWLKKYSNKKTPAYFEYEYGTINEQISNFAQTYPTNLKASSNEALLFMRRYRFANCSCFSCCFKDAYPSSNVQ